MLNVLTYRPEFAPPWTMHSHMTPITLNRLDRPEVEALIGHQANGKAVPSEVIEHIVGKTDGVPLYVEELTKSILGSDYLHEETDRYTLAGSLSEVAIPATLQDTLMARLDRLPGVRELAQLGAVLGREFAYQMLQYLAPLEEPVLQDGLGQLVANELLYQRGRPPRSRYIFRHALIQDAAYQSLLRRTRQQYHQQVAELMEERFPETVEAHPELVAHHFGEAGCAEEAVTYSHKAGQIALARSANVEAATHLERGLELLAQLPETPERHERELEMQMALGPALVAARGFADAGVGDRKSVV
jgi:predicted ATPase